jgi:hypothetical protein
MTKHPPGPRCAAAFRKHASGRVPEARHLLVLRGQVRDRVEHEVGELEDAVDPRPREVPDRDSDPLRAGLRAKLLEHRLGDVDAVHRHASPAERKCNPPGADPELEGRAVAGQLLEKAHRRVEHLGSVLVDRGLVVACSNLFVELDLRHAPAPVRAARTVRE